jgi:hypothetical protein
MSMKLPGTKLPVSPRWIILGAFTLVLVAACATRPMGPPSSPAFFNGIIDGLLAPISFVISLFSDTVRMYAFPNVGRWYDFGFLFGISAWGGGSAVVVRRY